MPSSARFDLEIAKMSYFDIVEQHTGIIHWWKGEKVMSQKWRIRLWRIFPEIFLHKDGTNLTAVFHGLYPRF